MLPKPVETPRLLELRAKIDAASNEELQAWPLPTKEDFWLFGGIVVLFSHIDCDLRSIAFSADKTGKLKEPWVGKTAGLTMENIEKAVRSSRDWEPENVAALDQVTEFRSGRQVVAHFAVRRFPEDEAFAFFTNSVRDYKRAFKTLPPPGVGSMSAVMERKTLSEGIHRIEKLHLWLNCVAVRLQEEWGVLPVSS